MITSNIHEYISNKFSLEIGILDKGKDAGKYSVELSNGVELFTGIGDTCKTAIDELDLSLIIAKKEQQELAQRQEFTRKVFNMLFQQKFADWYLKGKFDSFISGEMEHTTKKSHHKCKEVVMEELYNFIFGNK